MTELIGRDAEMNILKQHLADAISGKGSTVLISGEPGIGKTRLVEEFRKHAKTEDVRILSGAAISGSAHPFQIFSRALEGVTSEPLFEEQEYTSFVKIFAINHAGMLVAQASSGEQDIDADIFAGMLSAVQNFITDSLGQSSGGLARLEYGDLKILIEHGTHLFLTAVFSGTENSEMKNYLRQGLRRVEEKHGRLLDGWSGNVRDIGPIQDEISALTETRFLVRKNLEGVKLENERIRIADRVLETLSRLSSEKPLVLFMEDMHWADESSLFVFNYMARNIRNRQILLLGTSRTGESDALQKAIDRMKVEGILCDIQIFKLDVENTRRLIDRTFIPNDFPETLAERLFGQSKGNPLFVVEILNGMMKEGNILKSGGKYSLVFESYIIPSTIEELVSRRLESLPPDSMTMAEYVSCIGQNIDGTVAVANRQIQNPHDSLEQLLESGILLKNNGTFEFSHAMFQSCIYNSIGDRWRGIYHRSIGEHFETAFQGRADDVIYELAHHYARAGKSEKAFDYCVRAGERAEGSFAVEQALGFYTDAISALPEKDVSQHCHKSMELIERIGDIRTLVGSYDRAICDFKKVGEMTDDREIKGRMLRKIGVVQEKMGEYDLGLETLARAKENTESNSGETGRIRMLEGILHVRKGNFDAAIPLFQEAIDIAEKEGGNKKDLGNAFRVLGATIDSKGDYDLAMEYYDKSLITMQSIGDQWGIAAALNNIGVVHNWRGEFDKALDFHARSLEIRKKIADIQGIALSLNNQGSIYVEKGELEKALGVFRQSLEIREKIGDKFGVAMSLGNIGNVYAGRGEFNAALEHYGRSLKIRETIGDKQGVAYSLNNIGATYIDKGTFENALEVHQRSLNINLEIGGKLSSIYSYNGLAEAYLGLGEMDPALENAEKAVRMSLDIGSMSEEGRSRRILGMVHRGMLHDSLAFEEFKNAAKILDDIGNKEELARAHYEHALLLHTTGQHQAAMDCMKESQLMFSTMGMKLWAEKCRKTLEELDP